MNLYTLKMTSGHSYVLARWNRGNSKACISERVWLATSRPLISYEYFILKSFFILNKFQLFREFLKSPLREQMSWRQSKNWVRRYTLDKRGWRSLLSKHWFWLWHGTREISFNFVRYLCCKEKNRLHQFYQSKVFDRRRKTHWKQRNISVL